MSKICIYGIIVQLSIYSLAFAFDSKAQNKSVNDIQVKLDLKAPAQLESIFEEIEKTTDFHFSYVDEQLNSSMYTVNLETRKMILGDLLMDISQQTDLSFRRVNNNIFIAKKRSGVERVVEVIETQKVIAGTVKDDRGEALPGATVQEKGTSNGTITDVEGNFTLNVPEQATLIVSFVGYETQEISVNNRSEIDIRLSEDAEQLAEVVVVGYGVQEKVNMTGAVGVVESKQLESRPVASVEEALQGQIPGLRIVRTSGQPGKQNIDINIRGVSTLTDNPVLIVID
ncbi:MAG: carboxypeptidase-like regulatory domain-containing protein, partial [Cyclobacteriaceae bacterium]